MQWILTSERNPEKEGYYFTYRHHSKSYPQVTFWYSDKGWSSATVEWLDESVSDGEKDKELKDLKAYADYVKRILANKAKKMSNEENPAKIEKPRETGTFKAVKHDSDYLVTSAAVSSKE